MMLWLKRTLLTLVTMAAAAALAWALLPKPVPVDLAAIRKGAMETTVDEEGWTRVRDVYEVSTPVRGRVLRLPVHVGDAVRRDETVVARLEPAAPAFLDLRSRQELEAAVGAAKAGVTLAGAEIERARAELALAEQELERARRLVESAAASRAALDRAVAEADAKRASLAIAQASLDLRRSELRSAEARLIQPHRALGREATECCIEVRSPVDGEVLRLIKESEQVVQAGDVLVEIGDPAHLEIVVELLTSDAVKVVTGAPARIENWGGPPFEARVERVEPAGYTKVSALGIEDKRVKAILAISTDQPPSRLGHDFRIFARIRTWQADAVPTVPLSALFRRGADWAVFRAVDGHARETRVEIGERNQREARIVSGLGEGDRVILHPSDRVTDGVRISERTASAR